MHEEDGVGRKYVDLHIHTSYSDGECSVNTIFEIVEKKELRTISITDHDNIDANPLALQIGKKKGIEVICGTELSLEIDGVDVHILGYFVDINNKNLKNKLKEMKEARFIRAKKIVQNLNRQGIDLRFETVLKIAGNGAIGRPHIATAMLNEELIYSFKEAFDKYIGYNSPAYEEKLQLSPKEVFRIILDSGGIPVLAHPGVTRIDHLIPKFIDAGLAGLEVYHPEHNSSAKRFYREYCRKRNLVITGGSDFHSHTQSKVEIGIPKLQYSIVRNLKQKLENIHGKKVF